MPSLIQKKYTYFFLGSIVLLSSFFFASHTEAQNYIPLEVQQEQRRLEEQRAKEKAKLAEQTRINECQRQLESTSPQCNLEQLFANVPQDPEEEVARELQIQQCDDAITACVLLENLSGLPGISEIERSCMQKRSVFDGGACNEFASFSSQKCKDFYNECIDNANWDAAAIAGILAGGANGGGAGGSKYPVRMTPEEYRKLNTPIPYCAFTYEGCRDVNDVVTLMVNIGKMIFSIIGVLAFVMFVYGGFTMILAMGNPEKFKKGTSILVAALVGLLIAFSAYLLIDFVLDSLGVSANFRGV